MQTKSLIIKRRVQIFFLILFLSFFTCSNGFGQTNSASINDTWLEQSGQVFGARPDENGSIGGGTGYQKIVTQVDYHIKDLDGLLTALKSITGMKPQSKLWKQNSAASCGVLNPPLCGIVPNPNI